MKEVGEYDLISKNKFRNIKGLSEAAFDALPLPHYPVGKSTRYRLCDYEPTLERIKKEKQWASIKTKSHRTGSMTSPSQVLDIEEARRQITRNRQQTYSQNSAPMR